MSLRYKGAVISATPPTTTGGESGVASGAWTLEQQFQAQGAGNWPTPPQPKYIEDVFSTYLYTGNGTTQTIVNGIDLSTKGGLVWGKNRTSVAANVLVDTARGSTKVLYSNATNAQVTSSSSNDLTSFNTNGFSVGPVQNADLNTNSANYVSWTFEKQAKFFDCGTYASTASTQTISHNLGSVPGCIIIKKLDSLGFNAGWAVYHRSLTNPSNYYLVLNTTAAETNYGGSFISNVTSTSFDVNGASGFLGYTGSSYVYYAFAHDAGGFGLTGTDNVISCGSFTTTGSSQDISLGYEPQWVMMKRSDSTGAWWMFDAMRGMSNTNALFLYANQSSAEYDNGAPVCIPTATGFNLPSGVFGASQTYIYIAIRRGPMKVPTDATKVFEPVTYTGTGADITISSSNVVDLAITMARTSGGFSAWDKFASTRLTGNTFLSTNLTDAEASGGNVKVWNTTQDSITLNKNYASYATNFTYVTELFKRAPSFFDVVCYTGTGSVTTQAHNLGVAPELLIVKRRNSSNYAPVWNKSIGNDYILKLFDSQTTSDDPKDGPTDVQFNQTAPTASVFTLGTSSSTNGSGSTYVAWMWATCAGVSKVGSYTGTGTTLQVNCGFTGGARFVLIKRTDATGDWYVWDSARGIVSGNDPYFLLNSVDSEVTNTDYVDTYSAGFEITSTAPAAINASGGTFIFLAIA